MENILYYQHFIRSSTTHPFTPLINDDGHESAYIVVKYMGEMEKERSIGKAETKAVQFGNKTKGIVKLELCI